MESDHKDRETTLDNLKQQQAKLNARIQAAEACSKTSGRKRETQRKV